MDAAIFPFGRKTAIFAAFAAFAGADWLAGRSMILAAGLPQRADAPALIPAGGFAADSPPDGGA